MEKAGYDTNYTIKKQTKDGGVIVDDIKFTGGQGYDFAEEKGYVPPVSNFVSEKAHKDATDVYEHMTDSNGQPEEQGLELILSIEKPEAQLFVHDTEREVQDMMDEAMANILEKLEKGEKLTTGEQELLEILSTEEESDIEKDVGDHEKDPEDYEPGM